MSDAQQPGPVLSAATPAFTPAPEPVLIPPAEPSIVLEWYPVNFQGSAIYSEKDRRDIAIVPYHHPMTIEMLLVSIRETFPYFDALDSRKLRLRRVIPTRGRDSWAKVPYDSWPSFLRPDDVVGIFVP
ncbi:hypothetical protein BKA70DRAFT_1423442 [Coprinopsis sp. MPI-PUGE-AT-0042]|nr:hypothetical protein BKA70DRAFT_1423442 [Coprinopsis sp. MPI-PUGE-AT-0042]